MDIQKVISQYPQDYCRTLELAYGEGMMSEGGFKEMDLFFSGIDLSNKKVLEIGFGLGGLASYIAKKHPTMTYIGVEINPQLVENAKEHHHHDNTDFICVDNSNRLPFGAEQFDIIFSKGVLVHLQDKSPLFKECFRVLKNQGKLLINDWLSPDGISFGQFVNDMCKLEGLTLYPVSIPQYETVMMQAGFQVVHVEDENKKYAQYNEDVVRHLQQSKIQEAYLSEFGEQAYKEALEAYGWVAKAFAQKELLTMKFLAQKSIQQLLQ